VVLTANLAGGDATVTGTYAATGFANVTGSAVVALPKLGQLNLLSQGQDILGVRYSGYQETSIVVFQAVDSANVNYPPGLSVNFTHQSLARSYIGASEGNCTVANPSICHASGVTDVDGKVAVLLTSGTAAGVVSVAANATAGGLSATGNTSNIAIVGAKASGAHITMDCFLGKSADNIKTVPAFSNSDCKSSYYTPSAAPIAATCKVALADRFNNVLGVSTLTQFFSEAGTAGPVAYTPSYNPKAEPSAQVDLGIAESYVRPDGKLPVDVAPFGGEFALAYVDGCNNGTHNPRDGLVTVISIATGEEGFVDLNGNGVYDPGEPYIDMGEPYIDANDNGTWDPGEFFVDLNSNGTYDGPNGKWDSDTTIWAETRLLFTGDLEGVNDGFTTAQFYTGVLPTLTAALPFSVESSVPGPATSQTYSVIFGDGNFNPLKGAGSYAIGNTEGHASAVYSLYPVYSAGPPLPGSTGISFTQQYCTKPNLTDITISETCANVCPSNENATNSPCYVVTNVGACSAGISPRSGCTGIRHGSIGSAIVTGGATTGADVVQATRTLGTSVLRAQIPGNVVPTVVP
jgi:hypothetical protein